MSTKSRVLREQSSCLNKAAPDEPVFVLRANDPTAAQVIRLWAAMNDQLQPPGKVHEALAIAQEFEDFNTQHCAQVAGEGYPSIISRVPAPAHVTNATTTTGTLKASPPQWR